MYKRQLINLLSNLFIGLSVGGNVLAARYFGARREKDLSETVHTAIMVSLISGVTVSYTHLICWNKMRI